MTVVTLNRDGHEVHRVEMKRLPGVGNIVIETEEEDDE